MRRGDHFIGILGHNPSCVGHSLRLGPNYQQVELGNGLSQAIGRVRLHYVGVDG
jgi:hypothetical protein